MLNEMMDELVKGFDERQNALIEAVGGNLKAIFSNMKKTKALNHGKPPYILDDGEFALLFVDRDGNCSKLPPSFSLSEETTSREFDVIYTLPVLGFGPVRFIPAQAAMVAPEAYQSNFVASAYSPQFLDGLSQYLAVMANAIPKLAALKMAKKLIQLQSAMETGAKGAGIELESFMQLREVRDVFVTVLGEAFVEGAQRVVETTIKAREEKA